MEKLIFTEKEHVAFCPKDNHTHLFHPMCKVKCNSTIIDNFVSEDVIDNPHVSIQDNVFVDLNIAKLLYKSFKVKVNILCLMFNICLTGNEVISVLVVLFFADIELGGNGCGCQRWRCYMFWNSR